MTEFSQADSAQPTTDDETQQYVEQLRSAPAGQVLTEVLLGVVNAAQVKLGRTDARVFIDLAVAMLDNTRSHVDADTASMVDQTLAQLRIAQVEAENQPGDDPPADS